MRTRFAALVAALFLASLLAVSPPSTAPVGAATEPVPVIDGFRLVDAQTHEVFDTYEPGEVVHLDPRHLPDAYDIEAFGRGIASVEFVTTVNGVAPSSRVENLDPYTVAGGQAGDDFRPVELVGETTTFTATPYSVHESVWRSEGGHDGPPAFIEVHLYEHDFLVDSISDDPDADPGDGVCATDGGTCTLRAAIAEANTLEASTSIAITQDPERTGHDGTYAFTNSQMFIYKPMRIDGSGTVTLDAQQQSRHFVIATDETVYLNSLEFVYGSAHGQGQDEEGGAIFIELAEVHLEHVYFGANRARNGGAVAVRWGKLFTVDVRFVANRAGIWDDEEFGDGRLLGGDGGTIHAYRSNVHLDRTNAYSNSATRYGGAIFVRGVTMSIDHSRFSQNYSGSNGGAIFSEQSWIGLAFSTVATNEAGFLEDLPDWRRTGGGLYLGAWGADRSAVLLAATTIVHNDTYRDGLDEYGDCAAGEGRDGRVTIVSYGANLIGNGETCLWDLSGEGDLPTLFGYAPEIGPDIWNPPVGGPAHDAVPTGLPGMLSCGGLDFFGTPRPSGGACDIGATEVIVGAAPYPGAE